MKMGDRAGAFEGSKLMLFFGEKLAVLRRDDFDHIPFPDMLDLPGGMREGEESPEACALRETHEELGLDLPEGLITWRRFYEEPCRAWFFALHLPEARSADIVFGDEGQVWQLMQPEHYAASDEAIPHFRARVLEYLAERRLVALEP
jgi:8-oxo-dGTP diphosphatase